MNTNWKEAHRLSAGTPYEPTHKVDRNTAIIFTHKIQVRPSLLYSVREGHVSQYGVKLVVDGALRYEYYSVPYSHLTMMALYLNGLKSHYWYQDARTSFAWLTLNTAGLYAALTL